MALRAVGFPSLDDALAFGSRIFQMREGNPLAGVSSVSPTGDTGLPFPVAPTKCRKLITKLFE